MESRVSRVKQYKRKKAEATFSQLPDDIVVEILSRLPVKSLLRFSSGCMSWLSTIRDPKFASIHLVRSSQTPATILKTESNQGEVHFRSICQDLDYVQDIPDVPWIEYTTPNYIRIIGSCNGLLVIDTFSDFRIWNPLTKCCKIINRPSLAIGYVFLCGLGYNSSLDNYKLVLAFPKGYADIFSFKSNSWKQIGTFIFEAPRGDGRLATLVDGAPHWKIGSHGTSHVVSFHLGNDEFKSVSLPHCFPKDFSWQLLNFSGCLSLLGHTRNWVDVGSIELWTMKEYGIKDSWGKIFVIPVPNVIQLTSYPFDYWKPWYFTTTGTILVKLDGGAKSFIYNPKEGTYEVIMQSVALSQSVPFVESLVCPMSLDIM